MLNMTSSYCIGTGRVVILPAVTIGYISITYVKRALTTVASQQN